MELQLKLTEFEGPLDLLLHLIKKQEIDIYDIPIAQITEQYLDYLHQMQELSLEVAGDYLIMAATLMAIKSRLLLPQSKVDELDHPDEEPEDPRQALVEQLLAYQAYQEVSHYLQQQAQMRARFFSKEETIPQHLAPTPLPKGIVSLDELGAALTELLQRQRQEDMFAAQTISRDSFSLDEALALIQARLAAAPQQTVSFTSLFVLPIDREQVVTLFLACLELMKTKTIICRQPSRQAPIQISKGVPA